MWPTRPSPPSGNGGLKRPCSHGVYWEHQVARTRCLRRKAKRRQALEASQGACDQHALTRCLPPQALQAWQAWAIHRVSTLQRASSAVEGRNGTLAQLHHNQRGVPKYRDKVWMVLHNFDCRPGEGTPHTHQAKLVCLME